MAECKKLLIIAHAPSENTQKMLEAVVHGASHPDVEKVVVTSLTPLETQPDDILSADAIILGTTENLGYMAGLVKDVFDRCYYACLDKTEGLPFAFYIRAGHDGTGTQRGIESITTGLRWRLIQGATYLPGRLSGRFYRAMRGAGAICGCQLGGWDYLRRKKTTP